MRLFTHLVPCCLAKEVTNLCHLLWVSWANRDPAAGTKTSQFMPFIMGILAKSELFLESPRAKKPAIYDIYYGFLGATAMPRQARTTKKASNLCHILCDLWPKVLEPFLTENHIIYAIYYAFHAIYYAILHTPWERFGR